MALLLLLGRVLAAEGRGMVVLLIAADDRGQLGARSAVVGDAWRGASAQRRARERPALVRELIRTWARMCALEEAAFVAELAYNN